MDDIGKNGGAAERKKRLGRGDFDWFDAEAYKPVEDYTPAEWANALALRAMLLTLAKAGHDSASFLVKSWLSSPIQLRGLEPMIGSGGPAVRDQTVEEAYRNGLKLEHGVLGEKLRECFPHWVAAPLGWGIKPEVVDAIRTLASAAERERHTKARDEYRTMLEFGFSDYGLPYSPMTQAGLQGVEFLSVDLSASDEQLQSEFASWLGTKRQRHSAVFGHMNPVKKKGGRVVNDDVSGHLRDALSYQVLPYVDLRLYALGTGCELTQALAGELLFSGEDSDTTEKVRKYTAPLAEYLLSLPSLVSISHWAHGEGRAASGHIAGTE